MKKKILALMLVLTMMFTFAACNETKSELPTETSPQLEETDPINVMALNGPTGMGMIQMMDNEKYNFTLTSDPTQVVSLMATGEVDIAACPLNIAANLFKKTDGGVQMLGINTLGTLYVVVNEDVVRDADIDEMTDLKGQTVASTGQGATVEYIINYLANENGMEIGKDLEVDFLSEHGELATKLATGEVGIAILPEPFVSVALAANDELEVELSLSDAWSDVNPETELAMGCVIARTDFVKENPEAIAAFIEDNKKSVEFVNDSTEEAAPMLVEKGILASEKIVMSATENCNIVFIDGQEMADIAAANFKVYFDANPQSIGGAMPTNDLYFIQGK